MLTKGKTDKKLRDLMFQFITVVVIAALGLLLLNVLSQDKDGRRQVVDNDGGTEYIATESGGIQTAEEQRLAEILMQIKGVGQAEVMITWHEEEAVSAFSTDQDTEKNRVKGVIIAAEGAGNAITKNDIIKAVSSVFNISSANVMVFEKETGEVQR